MSIKISELLDKEYINRRYELNKVLGGIELKMYTINSSDIINGNVREK